MHENLHEAAQDIEDLIFHFVEKGMSSAAAQELLGHAVEDQKML